MANLKKKCPDCGHERCRKHNREKTAKWRANASDKELKAKSMQVAYRAASGKTLSLSLKEARDLIECSPVCPYCGLQILWKELSIDHKIPISRGGSNEASNLIWVDLPCNIMKGNLTSKEFLELLDFLKDKPTMKQLLQMRLKAAGFMYRKH